MDTPITTYSMRFACRVVISLLMATGMLVDAVLVDTDGKAAAAESRPLALHADNPRYLLFRTEPTVLITSAEHYGAVLNADFDTTAYLDELAAERLNLTRTFSGVYCEDKASFNIKDNTLAPAKGRLICPWVRSDTPGYAGGGNKFDLDGFDEAYFARLKHFVAEAGRRGIVVEMVLFCPFYKDTMWNLSPMKAANNVNDIGHAARTDVYTLKHKDLLSLHKRVTRKIVNELAEFDNVYFEICNEPYFGGVTREWQDQIIATIVDAEKALPRHKRHLIAQNIANKKKKVERPNPAVSIFNFHYATPPETVAMNWGLNKVLGDDETGFDGSGDFTYRAEGWDFILAGGAIYNNLDYSFTPDKENGTAVPNAPGGGGRALRKQLRILKDFVHGFDFITMKPDGQTVAGQLPKGVTARALVQHGKQYAVYVRGGGLKDLTLKLPKGNYQAEWLNTKTGKIDQSETFRHAGGPRKLTLPSYSEDIALRVLRRGP